MILNLLFGVVHHNPPYAGLSISFNELQISPIEEKMIYNAKQKLINDPEDGLMNR